MVEIVIWGSTCCTHEQHYFAVFYPNLGFWGVIFLKISVFWLFYPASAILNIFLSPSHCLSLNHFLQEMIHCETKNDDRIYFFTLSHLNRRLISLEKHFSFTYGRNFSCLITNHHIGNLTAQIENWKTQINCGVWKTNESSVGISPRHWKILGLVWRMWEK